MDIKKFLTPKYLLIGGIAVIGGLFLASKFRPKAPTEPETVVATPISQPYAVANTEGYSPYQPGKTDSAPQPKPPVQNLPKPYVPPVIGIPVPGAPGATLPPKIPLPVPHIPTPTPTPVPGPTLPGTPRKEPTPPTPGPPPVVPNVPGGYTPDCRGVLPRPSDHPGASIGPLIRAKGGNTRARAYALEWVFLGIANSGATGLSRFTQWIAQKAIWPRVNTTRRTRGLRPYTEAEFNSAISTLHQLNVQTGGRDDRLTEAMLQDLWAKYHVPYLCG